MVNPLLALSMPGGPELVFIFLLCLLFFGANKLPELARGLGKSIGEFQKAKAEIEREIMKASAPVQIQEQADKVGAAPQNSSPKEEPLEQKA